MFRRIASIFLVLSLLLLAFSQLQLGEAHASVLAAVATSTRTRTRTPTRTATSSRTPTVSRTPTKSPTPASVVTGSVALQNTTAPYGEVGHVTATFTAQSTAAQVTQMRTAGSWGTTCIDVTIYASWEAFVTSRIYDYTNWNSDQYLSIAVQYQDALGNLSPVYCTTIPVPGAPTPTPSNTPTLIPTTTGAAPDLTVVSIQVAYQTGTYSGTCRLADAPVAVRATIQNIGNQDAGAFSVVFNGSTYSFTGLAAGQTAEITTSYGTFLTYARTATVDSANVIAERDENNNTLTVTPSIAPMCTATPVPTADPLLPDLMVSSITRALDPSIQMVNGCYPSVLTYGTSVSIYNLGGVGAGAFSVTLNIGGVDYIQTVTGLPAGQGLSLWFNVSLSRPATATVDSTNAVVESNENNSLSIYVSSGTATPTGTQPPTSIPCKTFTPTGGVTATPTPTLTVGTPTRTPTITLTPTLPAGGQTCSPVTSTITGPFTYDGAGVFCWQSSSLGSTFINSWNTTKVTINGIDITNTYTPSSSYPAKINGFWYITYSSSVAWAHFETK